MVNKKVLSYVKAAKVGMYTIVPILLFLAVSLPITVLVAASLFDLDGANTQSFTSITYAANYFEIISSFQFWNSFRRTIVLTLSTLIISILVGGIFSWALLRVNKKAASFLMGITLIPLFLPPTTSSLIWYFQFNPNYGPLGYFLYRVFEIEFLSPKYALMSIVFVESWRLIPFTTLIIYLAIRGLSGPLTSAVKLYGANIFMGEYFVRHMKNTVIMLVALTSALAAKSFESVFILTSGGPGNITETFPMLIYKLAFQRYEVGVSSAASILYLGILFGITVLVMFKLRGKS